MSKNRLKCLGAVAVVIIILTAGITLFGLFSTNSPGLSPSAIGGNTYGFPPTLATMQLTEIISGRQAISMISNLHGTSIMIKEGYILTYAGLTGQAMIWISKSGTEADARQLFRLMDDKISNADKGEEGSQGTGGPPFYNRRIVKQNGIDVIAVEGMGMENYFYLTGAEIYWIAVAGPAPLQTLQEVIKRSKLPG